MRHLRARLGYVPNMLAMPGGYASTTEVTNMVSVVLY
jgi:hypothetical protein